MPHLRVGNGKGFFNGLMGLACDATAAYVADHQNCRIQKFALRDGKVLGVVGRRQHGPK